MIYYKSGDIFESTADALVNTVNTEGIMGKGLALQFKKKFPENFKAYVKACKNKDVVIGKIFPYIENSFSSKKVILNFPTKISWRNKSQLSSITLGLQDLVHVLKALDINSVAIPPLGCGLGGLSWSKVKIEIEKAFAAYPEISVFVYEPLKEKNFAPVPTNKPITQINAIILCTFKQYMINSISTDLTFIEAHKLCYFLQEFGLDLKLRYVPYCYGPYANNLKFVLQDLEGVWISGSLDNTANPFDRFKILNTTSQLESFLTHENRQYIDRILSFLDGYESILGLELLGTIHWLAIHYKIPLEYDKIFIGIKNWCSGDKRNFGARKIQLFSEDLIKKGIERVKTLVPEFVS